MSAWQPIDYQKVWVATLGLEEWLRGYGWYGYDPYDVKASRLYRWLQHRSKTSASPGLRLFERIEAAYPLLVRKLLFVPKQINPKAIGLFATSYLYLYQLTGKLDYQSQAISCLEWLEQNVSKGYQGFSWGYPFDWQSYIFLPKGTPSAVVSSVIGDSFWLAYQMLGKRYYLQICDQICQFFVNHLHIDIISDQSICFSYTPLDHFHVHNANLMVAEFLTRVGVELANDQYQDLGARAARYALQEQNEDGSLYYWGKDQSTNKPGHIDHYHSGFEIRSLFGLWKNTSETAYLYAVEQYYHFYQKHLLRYERAEIIPKYTNNRSYPIDIHACAEAVLLNATLSEDFPEAANNLHGLMIWTIENMASDQGWFIYRRDERKRQIRIPYLRWGQAWMLRALTACLMYASESLKISSK